MPERAGPKNSHREALSRKNDKRSIGDFGFQNLLRRMRLRPHSGRTHPRRATALGYVGRCMEAALREVPRGALRPAGLRPFRSAEEPVRADRGSLRIVESPED